MVEIVLQTDERENLITSLTMLSLALAQTQKDLSFWKWAVIATHNALQNAMVNRHYHKDYRQFRKDSLQVISREICRESSDL